MGLHMDAEEVCERPCNTSKTVRLNVAGTTGLGCPVGMSQSSMVSVGPNWTSWSTSLDVAV